VEERVNSVARPALSTRDRDDYHGRIIEPLSPCRPLGHGAREYFDDIFGVHPRPNFPAAFDQPLLTKLFIADVYRVLRPSLKITSMEPGPKHSS